MRDQTLKIARIGDILELSRGVTGINVDGAWYI